MMINTNLSKLANYLIVVFFFVPYLGLIPVAYGLMLLMIGVKLNRNLRISYYDFFYIIILFITISFKFNQVNFFVGEAILRYYLGVVIVYWFVKLYNVKFDIQKLLLLFCICVFAEAVVINVFFDPFRYLPNYPLSVFENNIASHYTKFMGFYQRPYSVGMNASASATILCGMLMYRAVQIKNKTIIEDKRIEFFGGIIALMFASGVGLGLYFFYLLYRFQLMTIRRFVILVVVCYLLMANYEAIFGLFSSDSIFQKVSSAYIDFLIDFKNQQIEEVISILKEGRNSIWIGQAFAGKSEIILQSDFAWNDFFQCLGISGLILFFLFLINKINKYTFFPGFLFLLGAFHYGGMFTLPGQIILAQILFSLSTVKLKNDRKLSASVEAKKSNFIIC